MFNQATPKDLYAHLVEYDYIQFGTVIPVSVVRGALGLVYPETASKKEFDQLALTELAAVDYVRNILLGQGMYLTQDRGDYRILFASENAHQVSLYMQSAKKKLDRAQKLNNSTPRDALPANDQTASRINAQRSAIDNLKAEVRRAA